MRRVLLSVCLLCVVPFIGATGSAYGADAGAVLSYAPAAPGPHSGSTGSAAHEGLKRFNLPSDRVCFGPAEARDTIASHKLTEPFQALQLGRWRGEALRARLCRWAPEKFVYEISVLQRDGRIVHVYMNALTGHNVEGQSAVEEPDDAQGE